MSPAPESDLGCQVVVVATGELATTSSPSDTPGAPAAPMPAPSPFAARFLTLPSEIQTHILLFLSPDELGVLSSVPQLSGIEKDKYLKAVWIRRVSGQQGAQ